LSGQNGGCLAQAPAKCAKILIVMIVTRRRQWPTLSRVLLLFFLLGAVLLPGVAAPSTTEAASGIAITGSFYRQPFEIPQGSSVAAPSVYVIVSNEGTSGFNVRMVTKAVTSDNVPEPRISISLSHVSFFLDPDDELKVLVTVDVDDAVPAGQYDISVTAESYADGGDPITISGSVTQKAALTVTGESASVTVNAVGPSGQPVVAQVRLFRIVAGEGYEVAYSNTGSLQAIVAPGTFRAEAYSLTTFDPLCDPSTFDVAANEVKTVTLTVRMVYFENDFVVIANYDSETKELLNARTLATLTNVFDTLANTEVRLAVTFNGDPLEVLTALGPLSLPVGQTGVPWNYIPAEGWKNGLYGFKYQLYVDGALVAETMEQTLKVGGGGGVASWLWIIFVILGVLGTAGMGFLIFFLLKRRQKGEKPEKAEKKERKKKEEKPAPKAAEPVGKPEPYRPAEHVLPVEPVRYEESTVEPTVEPATLSSVSSLKARMASMGRDRGTGKPAEEEPDGEKKDEPVETGPLASQPVPVPPPPKIEPERPAIKKVEEKGHKPPASEKPAGHKPGIFSKVTATGKKEPPKPPVAQEPAPVKPGDEITINWPPKTVEPPKPPSDVQINWPPKPIEPPKPSALEEAARQRVEAQQSVVAPEAAAPEEPGAPEIPPSRSSFSEAARLRMEARQRASETRKPGAGPEESQTEGDAKGGSGEGGDHSPSP
jgi:hypothetical protein